VLNVGSNYEVSIGDTARLIARLMRREVEFVADEQRLRPAASEVERLWADNRLARELAGWQPEYAGLPGLERGLAETIDWFAEPAHLGRYKAGRYNI
jgi:dTDP-glucose 4,6-dehydratase